MGDFEVEKSIKMLIIRFSSHIENIEKAVRETSEFVLSLNKQIDTYGLKLVLSEGITNAVVHGNRENERHDVAVKIVLTDSDISIYVKDRGAGFNWRHFLKEAEGDGDDLEATSGRGINLMRAYGYEVSFNKSGNTLCLSQALRDLQNTA